MRMPKSHPGTYTHTHTHTHTQKKKKKKNEKDDFESWKKSPKGSSKHLHIWMCAQQLIFPIDISTHLYSGSRSSFRKERGSQLRHYEKEREKKKKK